MMSEVEALEQAQERLGYRFRDPGLLATALRHASSAEDRLESNERQEFLGDAVLGFVVSEYLYRQFPHCLEGELTKIKSAVVSRRVCAKVSQELGLTSLLKLGKGMSERGSLPASVSAAVVEAIIAAMYLDGGLEVARQFILRYFEPYIVEAARSRHQHNFKSVLQQYTQRCQMGNPLYVVLDEKGPDHAKAFEVCVQIGSRRFGSAWANSKKEAEQKAALEALRELGLVIEDETGRIDLRTEPEEGPTGKR